MFKYILQEIESVVIQENPCLGKKEKDNKICIVSTSRTQGQGYRSLRIYD